MAMPCDDRTADESHEGEDHDAEDAAVVEPASLPSVEDVRNELEHERPGGAVEEKEWAAAEVGQHQQREDDLCDGDSVACGVTMYYDRLGEDASQSANDVKRVETSDADEEEARAAETRAQFFIVGVPEDESAEGEEEVYGEVTLSKGNWPE